MFGRRRRRNTATDAAPFVPTACGRDERYRSPENWPQAKFSGELDCYVIVFVIQIQYL
jgi:hypothetical protein